MKTHLHWLTPFFMFFLPNTYYPNLHSFLCWLIHRSVFLNRYLPKIIFPHKQLQSNTSHTSHLIFFWFYLSFLQWSIFKKWDQRHKKKLYGPILWMGFNCIKATEPLLGDSLLFTTKSPGGPGTHLIDLRKMKGWANLGAT